MAWTHYFYVTLIYEKYTQVDSYLLIGLVIYNFKEYNLLKDRLGPKLYSVER